jgi:L-rhamnose mutarotase
MERVCFSFRVAPGAEEEYDRRHRDVWPELRAALRDHGVRNYTLFRRGPTVVAYAECHPDAATAFGGVGATEVNRRWSQWFEGVVLGLTDDAGRLHTLPEVWHLD